MNRKMEFRNDKQIKIFYRALIWCDFSRYCKLNALIFSFEDKILNEKSTHSLAEKLHIDQILLFI